MQNPNIVFIGMDTHKETSDISVVLDGYGQQATHLGKIPSRKNAVEKLVRQMQTKHPRATLHFAYEAGPCGYWMYRLLVMSSVDLIYDALSLFSSMLRYIEEFPSIPQAKRK